jgi:hypothetical protein
MSKKYHPNKSRIEHKTRIAYQTRHLNEKEVVLAGNCQNGFVC